MCNMQNRLNCFEHAPEQRMSCEPVGITPLR